MDNQLIEEATLADPDTAFAELTEQHLNDWLQLQDLLRDSHAPADQLAYCRKQVTRLQLELFQLRNG